jgi:hypothetical protein
VPGAVSLGGRGTVDRLTARAGRTYGQLCGMEGTRLRVDLCVASQYRQQDSRFADHHPEEYKAWEARTWAHFEGAIRRQTEAL